MIQIYRVIRKNWFKNHSHHGGAKAVARCLLGTLTLRTGLATRRRTVTPAIDILTFSVVPWMTALWASLLIQTIGNRDAEILIGDCSGGFGGPQRDLLADPNVRVVPCLNEHHGDKIDLFLARLCRARHVLIADDDVFWLDYLPLRWAIAELDSDPRVAAVSLLPRREVSSVMRHDGISQPIGSHCLLIRRELWMRERLSFAVAPPPPGVESWFYDTGDLANRELLRRGFRVVVATPEIERHFVAFDGVSSWILKIRGSSPAKLEAMVAGIPVRQSKAWQATLICRGLSELLADLGLTSNLSEIVGETPLSSAERVLEEHMDASDRAAIGRAVEKKLERMRKSLAALSHAATAPT